MPRLKAPGQRLSTEPDRPREHRRQRRAQGKGKDGGRWLGTDPMHPDLQSGVFLTQLCTHPSIPSTTLLRGKPLHGDTGPPAPRDTHTEPPLRLPPPSPGRKIEETAPNEPGELLSGSFPLRWAGDRREPPARSAPRAPRCRRRAMKLQRLSFPCSTEHKNPARKNRKGKKQEGTGKAAGRRGACTARQPQKHLAQGEGKGTGAQAKPTRFHFGGVSRKIKAKSVIKVYLRVQERERTPDYGIEMSLFSCICLTQFYLVAFCTISCSFCC